MLSLGSKAVVLFVNFYFLFSFSPFLPHMSVECLPFSCLSYIHAGYWRWKTIEERAYRHDSQTIVCITVPWREFLSRYIFNPHAQRFWPGKQRSVLVKNRRFRCRQTTDLEKPQCTGDGRKFRTQTLIVPYSLKSPVITTWPGSWRSPVEGHLWDLEKSEEQCHNTCSVSKWRNTGI